MKLIPDGTSIQFMKARFFGLGFSAFLSAASLALFDGTIEENLRLANPGASELDLRRAVQIAGADDVDVKERRLMDFAERRTRVLVSKPSICGFGLNWQHCHHVICFPSYSFEDFYQLIRRSYRFGQKHPVKCYLILPRMASNVMKTLREKLEKYETMKDAMRFSVDTILKQQRKITMKTDIETKSTPEWTLHNGDCVRVAETIADESIDFSVFSPPFADLFVYSADVQDMGNCRTMDEFLEQFGFLVKHLFRVTKPGRLCAVHCTDLMATKWKDGDIELKNFSGEIIDLFRQEDWLYHCRVTIWKDPVVEMQRTKALGLLHKQIKKNSAMVGCLKFTRFILYSTGKGTPDMSKKFTFQ